MARASGRELFDPSEPFDAMAEMFRRRLVEMVQEAQKIAIYREMAPQDQLLAMTGGILVGLVGVAFCSFSKEGRDPFIDGIVKYLPEARAQAEAMLDEPGA
jgi:hypothetical protein